MKSEYHTPSKIYISLKNRKNFNIPSFSLYPGRDCRTAVPCYDQGCYARGMLKYDNMKKSWKKNSDVMREDLGLGFEQIGEFLIKKEPEYFRVHVAGDFFSQEYFDRWMEIARLFPDTSFSCYTKRTDFNLLEGAFQQNFFLFESIWIDQKRLTPGQLMNQLPKAYTVASPRDIPAGRFLCPGSCENCKHCYEVKQDVVFLKKRFR